MVKITKMNIAISFCGEGLGHASRISAIASELKKYHNLSFWCPEQVQEFFKKNYGNCNIYSVPLLSLVKNNNKLDAFKTVKINFKNLLFNTQIVDALAKQLINLKIEVVISDYEPFLVKASQKAGIPFLLFNHPSIITRFPTLNLSYFFSRVTANFMMPSFHNNSLIISSFYNGDVGPIIRKEVQTATIKKHDFILIYLKTSLRDKILPILEMLSDYNFRFFPNENYDFVESLASCKAVIAPAGHQLISECLYLKKPLLVIPEAGQYEQLLNAKMLTKTGLGEIISENDMKKSICTFIRNVEKGVFRINNNIEKFIINDDTKNTIDKINNHLLNIRSKQVEVSSAIKKLKVEKQFL